MSAQVRITEIFYSLQGESRSAGLPTVFVRLTGCPLRCGYCDTAYAFAGGELKTIAEIVAEVDQYQAPYITITGGEPLAQKNCWPLTQALCDLGAEVSIETSGAIDVGGLDGRAIIVMDLKTPASGESHRNLYDNLALLRPQDQIKFVLCNRQDYEWAKFTLDRYGLTKKVDTVLFSPTNGELSPRDLADWILQDRLPVRFQLQLHKYIWGNEPGR